MPKLYRAKLICSEKCTLPTGRLIEEDEEVEMDVTGYEPFLNHFDWTNKPKELEEEAGADEPEAPASPASAITGSPSLTSVPPTGIDKLKADMTVPEMQSLLDSKGIKYHHKAREQKLAELIILNKLV